ncbi:MAG: PilN domain-containing protein [Chitinivibrionales bacterium]|nr:PilN domain-containing protein [Chitinivibrionales bacterium]
MQQYYGIVHTDDDTYCLAHVSCDEEGKNHRLVKTQRWESQNFYKRLALMHRGVSVGVAAWCVNAHAPIVHDDSYQIPLSGVGATESNDEVKDYGGINDTEKESEQNSTAANSFGYTFISRKTEQQMLTDAFKPNLLRICSEDACLVTLVLQAMQPDVESCIAVLSHSTYFTIGIVYEKKLQWSGTFTPATAEALPSHIGRIERYLHLTQPQFPCPEKICIIGSYPAATVPATIVSKQVKHLCPTVTDPAVLRAMGVALTGRFDGAVPTFRCQSQESAFRFARVAIYMIAALMLGVTLLGVGGATGLQWWYSTKKNAYEKEYQKVIAYNKEVKTLLAMSNKMAEGIIRLETTLSQKTVWGQFFQMLGQQRPANIYFDKLGSEPIPKNESMVRIALTGWTQKESDVTSFIAKLQELSFVTRITLASMERDPKQQSIYRFKIVCSLILNGQ